MAHPRPAVAAVVQHLLMVGALSACSAPSEFVGSRRCDELAPHVNGSSFPQVCERCQGADCMDTTCSALFPCVDGAIVVQGCDEDSDCSTLGQAECGAHSGPDHVCMIREL